MTLQGRLWTISSSFIAACKSVVDLLQKLLQLDFDVICIPLLAKPCQARWRSSRAVSSPWISPAFSFSFLRAASSSPPGWRESSAKTPKSPGWKHLAPLPVRSWRRASPVTTNYTRWYWYHSLRPSVYWKYWNMFTIGFTFGKKKIFESSHLANLANLLLAYTALLLLSQQGASASDKRLGCNCPSSKELLTPTCQYKRCATANPTKWTLYDM